VRATRESAEWTPKETRIRGGEHQLEVKVEHLTEPYRELAGNIRTFRALKTGVISFTVTAGSVLAVLLALAHTTPKIAALIESQVVAGSFLALPARAEQHKAEVGLAANAKREIPMIQTRYRNLYEEKIRAKPYASVVIPNFRRRLVKLSTLQVDPKEPVSRGTSLRRMKTTDRIAFRPPSIDSLFGSDREANEALDRVLKEDATAKKR
jgi:hypothetical protein